MVLEKGLPLQALVLAHEASRQGCLMCVVNRFYRWLYLLGFVFVLVCSLSLVCSLVLSLSLFLVLSWVSVLALVLSSWLTFRVDLENELSLMLPTQARNASRSRLW